MEVIAFVGPSGSGKSHRAIGVAHQYQCQGIIDDGLLIEGAKILAGTSAKSEQNRVQAVKRAIFYDDAHASEVRQALARSGIRRLLILATSDKMIEKITQRLSLPKPLKTVYITDIATRQEIKKAHEARLRYGKHIVPVPTVELKQHFGGFFANLPYNLFSKNRNKREDRRSIVRPAFSYYGLILISDYVIEDIINLIVERMVGVARINYIHVRRRSDSRGLFVHVELVLYYGVRVFEVSRILQSKIKRKVERMTGMQVQKVNISIRSLEVRSSAEDGSALAK
ncbi:MAG: Asp23/Gls24 family envelope stress response protein [Acidaminococcaceae bacterium]|nr:Asp23/Gls24 family envelope stress response protein [Acidaminococcaceae bacterium]